MDELRRRLETEAMTLAFIAGIGVVRALFFVDAPELAALSFTAAPLAPFGRCVLATVQARLRYRYWALQASAMRSSIAAAAGRACCASRHDESEGPCGSGEPRRRAWPEGTAHGSRRPSWDAGGKRSTGPEGS